MSDHSVNPAATPTPTPLRLAPHYRSSGQPAASKDKEPAGRPSVFEAALSLTDSKDSSRVILENFSKSPVYQYFKPASTRYIRAHSNPYWRLGENLDNNNGRALNDLGKLLQAIGIIKKDHQFFSSYEQLKQAIKTFREKTGQPVRYKNNQEIKEVGEKFLTYLVKALDLKAQGQDWETFNWREWDYKKYKNLVLVSTGTDENYEKIFEFRPQAFEKN